MHFCFSCICMQINLYYRLFRQILNEVLRLTTLGTYAARYPDDDIVVGGYLIPAGTPIMIALGVSLKNETIWKNTEKLDMIIMLKLVQLEYSCQYRFDHTQCPHLQSKDLMAFIPFGHGRRRCPGYHFAYVEVSVILTILLQKFIFEPVGEAKDVGKVHGLVTTPKEPLKFHVSLNKQ